MLHELDKLSVVGMVRINQLKFFDCLDRGGAGLVSFGIISLAGRLLIPLHVAIWRISS